MTDSEHPRKPKESTAVKRAEFWLQLCFAIVACLGGFVLASGSDRVPIMVIAVVSSVIGFVFVDRLRWFSLPAIAAYVCMGSAAIYCVGNFWDLRTTGDEQMNAVALLLVLVQAILMLQHKSPRIFEQLCVFCLLELVVGAVFNDAINFGILLVPIAIIAAVALVLMSSVSASEGIQSSRPSRQARCKQGDRQLAVIRAADVQVADGDRQAPQPPNAPRRLSDHWLLRPVGFVAREDLDAESWSTQSLHSLALPTVALRRYVLMTLAPAVLLVTAVFFYALPRTTAAVRLGSRGQALVGFSGTVQLEQFGQMLKNRDTALRIELVNRTTNEPYLPLEPIYLRGRVLENYKADFDAQTPTSQWDAVELGLISGQQRLPLEYIPSSLADRRMFDSVDVKIAASSMQERSLFAIAPYHSTPNSASLVHAVDRWTIARKDGGMAAYPPMNYGFGTNAFFQGQQSEIITRTSTLGRMMSSTIDPFLADATVGDEDSLDEGDADDISHEARTRQYRPSLYLASLTRFDTKSMPTIAKISRDLLNSIPPSRRTTVEIAKSFERHLSIAGGYSYTLDLDAKVPAGVDPIEFFIAQDKQGHCQYFASALVMMLRSVNIPSRLIVGYRTDEYNDMGQYFVARQLHAHAWVEALIEPEQMNRQQRIFGQAPSGEYWLRLDPTPGDESVSPFAAGNVDKVMDMAENLWEKYVVSMDSQRQKVAIPKPDNQSWLSSAFSWFPRAARALQSPDWLLALSGLFSWHAAVIGVAVSITALTLARLRLGQLPGWRWLPIRIRSKRNAIGKRSEISFYADALDQLERVGALRRQGQTPTEFLKFVESKTIGLPESLVTDPLRILTRLFFEARYAKTGRFNREDAELALRQLKAGVRSLPPQTFPR